jgi:hypothetical protein
LQNQTLKPIFFLTQDNVDPAVIKPWASVLRHKDQIHVYDELSGACFLGAWKKRSAQEWAEILGMGLER